MYSQATPRLLTMCVTGCEQPTVSKQKFDYSFLNLLDFEDQFSAMEDAVVHLDIF